MFKKFKPVCQLNMSLFSGVFLVCFGEFLCDDQLGDVDSVTQEVRDSLLGVLHCPVGVSVCVKRLYIVIV